MQNNQCLGDLITLVKDCKIVENNKITSSYLCVKSIDLVKFLEHLLVQDIILVEPVSQVDYSNFKK